MERITSIAQYKQIVSDNRKRFGKVVTNCFVLPGNLQEFIHRQRMYFQRYEQGVVALTDEGRYYNCYYFWNADAPLDDLRQDKPVLVEELNNRHSRDAYLAAFAPKLLAAGFVDFKYNLQLENPVGAHLEELEADMERRMARFDCEHLTLKYCDSPEMLRQSVALWESALDATDIPLDHMQLRDTDKLLCVVNQQGQVCATNWWRNTGKSSEGRHTVTHPDYYRKGIASILLLAWCIDAAKSGAEKAIGWAEENNTKSIAMQEKVGFFLNERTSKQYILK